MDWKTVNSGSIYNRGNRISFSPNLPARLRFNGYWEQVSEGKLKNDHSPSAET
jgi:hypothetical protein